MKLVTQFVVIAICLSANQSFCQVKIVQINCPDSVGFITNMGQTKPCEFIFDNESPNLFYVEKFTHQNFHDLIYKDSLKLISRSKLVTPDYIPAIHDFVFAWNKNNKLLFFYILKDHQEERLLVP